MAETAAVISRDKEEIQNSSDDEDRFPTHNAVTASPGCSVSPSLDSLYEDKGISAVPERLSVLSSRVVAQGKALAGPEMVSGGQAQTAAPGLAEHPLAAVDALLGGSSYPVAADSLLPEDIASLHPKRPCGDGELSSNRPCGDGELSSKRPCSDGKLSSKRPCGDGELSSEALQTPRAPAEASEALQAQAAPGDCRTQRVGSSTEGSMASCLDRAIWMKTTKVMETLENKKKEEKEKYRLQLAMYRRLLLLRSIRSLHRQLEQQQARLQECYGSVINTKKEVLKHICSASPSPSP